MTEPGPHEVHQLNLLCAEGMRCVPLNTVQRVRFLNAVLDSELHRALDVLANAHNSQKKSVSVQFSGEGKRTVKVGYVVEAPMWKSSYRLVLDKAGKATLQGWAIVENTSEEDWKDVRMALVSSRPISFQMDLYQPLFVPRPVVEPERFASLRPPVYDGPLDAIRRTMSRCRLAGWASRAGGSRGSGQAWEQLSTRYRRTPSSSATWAAFNRYQMNNTCAVARCQSPELRPIAATPPAKRQGAARKPRRSATPSPSLIPPTASTPPPWPRPSAIRRATPSITRSAWPASARPCCRWSIRKSPASASAFSTRR